MIEDSKLQGYEIDTDQDIKNLIGDFHSSNKKNIHRLHELPFNHPFIYP